MACEHIEQQVDLKVGSVVSASGDVDLWRSKNMFVLLPALHFVFPVTRLVAEQSVSVPVQQRLLVHVAALPVQYVEPALLTLVKPDEQSWAEHVAFATQHVLFFEEAVGSVQSADARAVVGENILSLSHITRTCNQS